MKIALYSVTTGLALVLASPAALAQERGPAPTTATPSAASPAPAPSPQTPSGNAGVFAGDHLTVGLGAVYRPSYEGSDDYVLSPLPAVRGSFRGIGINPRAGGIALDLIDDGGTPGPNFSLGPAARLRMARDGGVKDEVVKLLPDLDTAVEVGAALGITLPGLLNPYDGLSFSSDIHWDIAGAHGGMTIAPSVSYFTPLSQGIVAAASIGAEYANGDFMDYYFSLDPAASATTGLPAFAADGGWKSAGGQMLLGFDLNGNLLDGGFALFVFGSYSRMLGDAADSPFTSIRGNADQWAGGAGLAYTF